MNKKQNSNHSEKQKDMKRIFAILTALMALCFTQCKPAPEGGEENDVRKVKIRCEIPINKGDRSDFTNLLKGKINWSDGRECVYLAIHGDKPQIIELESWSDGNQSRLEFEGEAAEGLIVSGQKYDVWYFGHSQQLETPYINNDGEVLTGSISTQSGRLEDLGYCHIAKTQVTAITENSEVKLNLNGQLESQMAIALLDLENVTELYGDAIVGTEYALEYAGERYELKVASDSKAKIKVESATGISYVVLLPNANKETKIKHKKEYETYAYTFHNYIKSNKIYHRTASDGATVEALKWEDIEEICEIDGHAYVDLGLPSGLLWATCNVGAKASEEYGDGFAWGETSTKETYTKANSQTSGKTMNDITGNAQYDAAAANWGGSWRMPTLAEMSELRNSCTWTWTTHNGVKGYKVTGPNGASIFLPAAGYRDGASYYNAGSYGYYWSSTPYADNADLSYYFRFNSGGYSMISYNRSLGMSVRPVYGGGFEGPEEQPGNEPETPEQPGTNQTFTVNGVSFTMIAVEGGTFQMGATSEQGSDYWDDELPVHSVTLSSYSIGETEVTQELWTAVMGSNPSNFSGYPKRPVECVSWNDCQTFITKLNQLTGKSFRLPTEAEWEYAARGGNKSEGYKYSGSNTIGDVAWYWDNSSERTYDVKTKAANELGIYDMSGNVWEWCQDWYGSYSSSSQTNPTGPATGSVRVLRGGGWFNGARRCRVSYRFNYYPDFNNSYYGFRLAL